MIVTLYTTLAILSLVMFGLGVFLFGDDRFPKLSVLITLGVALVMFGLLALQSFEISVVHCENVLVNSTIMGNTTTNGYDFTCTTNNTVDQGLSALFIGLFLVDLIFIFMLLFDESVKAGGWKV